MSFKSSSFRSKFILVWPLVLSLFLFILIFACGTPGKNLPVSEGIARIGNDNVQEIDVQVESFYFKPSRITVLAGTPVRLNIKSGTFIIPHNFSLHAPEAGIDINKNIGHGKSTTVEFTPTKAGEYQFFCDKDGHAKKGMVGTLVVKSEGK